MRRILSLGAGVQSTTVLLLIREGELPPIDCAVFADTGWEPQAVYQHLEWLKTVAPCPVHIVSQGNIRDDALVSQVGGRKSEGSRWASIPFRVLQANGDQGMIRRQCTSEYKIQPIERFIRREMLGLDKGQRAPLQSVEQLFGISTDEMRRVRVSKQGWTKFSYPLIDLGMSREDCLAWCESRGYPTPPRSACIGCPYKSDAEWSHLRETSPEEWQDAVDFDEAIRNMEGMRGQVFLHGSYRPLSEVNLEPNKDQGLLFEDEACEGMCGV